MNKASFRAAWRLLCAACACFLLANTARAAGAPNCKPLQLINSIKMTANENRSRYFVPVAINGVPKTLLLDTAGGRTQLTEEVAKELNLAESYSTTMRDLYGHTNNKMAHVETFDIGRQHGKNLYFHIAPMPGDWVNSVGGVVGLLSTDLFQEYDIDMDFAALRLNYFSQDHCEGKVVYWPERPLAIVPFRLRDGHITLDVTLDGKIFDASLDTGAPVTTTGVTDVIEAFHFEPGSPDFPIVRQIEKAPDIKIYGHNFERLSFGDITVLHPQIQLYPSIALPNGGDLSRLRQIIVGINVLRQLHVYVAYDEKKLYITPAGDGTSALDNPAATP